MSKELEGDTVRRDLVGWRVLITGASRGIGRELSLQAAKAGARVLATGRDNNALLELAAEATRNNGECQTLPGDITNAVFRSELLAFAEDKMGGLDGLVNNAGQGTWNHVRGGDEATFRSIMETNFFAPIELIRAAVPMLRHGRTPAILNVSSRCGRCALPSWSEYSASKAALVGMTESLRTEFARFDIDVLLALPGKTATDFLDNCARIEGKADLKFSDGMPPARVASALLGALRKGTRESWIGSDARWMLLIRRFFPGIVRRLLARKVRQLYATT
jgi:short-subunit dehydrogenase